ncbi:MAG TPA: hypothetical protein VN442_18790 [Bryobacteraceae bacterium]|nr:hypothetical protein [Bryobacteraceae bacterium]
MPDRIDRSIMHSYSGGVQTQLVQVFKCLKLVEANSAPSDTLKALIASDGSSRQTKLAAIVREAYPFLFNDGFPLGSATGKQLIDAFTVTGISGDSVRKAIAFFLGVAKDAGIQTSPYFKKLKLRAGQNGTKRVQKTVDEEGVDGVDDEDENREPQSAQRGSSRTITLRGGGSATLSFDVDVWSMTAEDQQFVFDMIKRMTEYEQAKASA